MTYRLGGLQGVPGVGELSLDSLPVAGFKLRGVTACQYKLCNPCHYIRVSVREQHSETRALVALCLTSY
jgi:hypothetical protein